MPIDRLSQRLMATFLGELEDHLRSLEHDLLALEKAPETPARSALFATLFRTAHSLKGAARSVGVEALEAAGHRLEDVFAAARDGRVPVDSRFFDLVLPTVDEIREAGRRLRTESGADAGQSKAAAPSVVPTLEDASPGPITMSAPAEGFATSERWSGIVRVAADKLDSLLMQSGELLIARHRAQARAEAARALFDATRGWRNDHRRLEQRLADALESKADPSDAQALPDAAVEVAPPWRQAQQLLAQLKTSQSQLVGGLQQLADELSVDCRSFDQATQGIDNDVRRVRMLPFAEACEGLGRMVRDLAGASGKKVELIVEGGEIEVDRAVLDGLKDALLHLIRNAVDHGIEPVAARRAAGKSEAGRITVAAALLGPRVVITVRDDGRGLDLPAIRERLRSRGVTPTDERSVVEHIFSAGFSTAPVVTSLSGRGVGLEVVKAQVQSLRGAVEVEFEPGRGTCFTLRVPLTLTSLRVVLVEAAGRTFAIDTASVDRVLRIGADDVQSMEGREVIMLDGRPTGIVTMAQLLGIADRVAAVEGERRPAIVLTDGARMAAFVVDDIRAEREVIIRSLGRRLRRLLHMTGATVLPDGGLALILNSGDLVGSVHSLSLPTGVAKSMTVAEAAQSRRLLLVDDSLTTRTLEKSILEGAGYEVLVAADGIEAWQVLVERGADLVVSDVEMPRMDGFSLTETIRRSVQFRELPVILMTARDDDTDKAKGLKAGANAYLFKSAFDQRELLAIIGQIL